MSCYRIRRGASKTQRLKVEKNLSFLTLRCLKASFSWSQQKLQPRTSAWWISTKEVTVIIATVSFFILRRLQKSTIQFHSRSFKLQFKPGPEESGLEKARDQNCIDRKLVLSAWAQHAHRCAIWNPHTPADFILTPTHKGWSGPSPWETCIVFCRGPLASKKRTGTNPSHSQNRG